MYDISKKTNTPDSQEKELELLKKLGFKVNKEYKVCKTIQDVVAYWKKWETKKESLPYMIDGVVVKVNEQKYQNALGYTGKAPRYSLALKFAPDQSTTVVEDIIIQVGRTGALTPVAVLRPVKIAGSTVKRATLHNDDEIKRLGLKIGDTIIIQKAGDIIPEVVSVIAILRPKNARVFTFPKKCPICGQVTIKKKGEVALYCSNKKCYAQELRGMIHFVAKGAFDIEGLGEKLVEKLMEQGLIRTPSDIFDLTEGDLAPLVGLGEKSAGNLITAIKNSKKIDESKFIFSLGIRFVGAETAELIAKNIKVKNPKELLIKLKNKKVSDLEKIEGIGGTTAKSVHEWIQSPLQQNLLIELHKNGILFTQASGTTSQSLTGKTFVLTGTLPSYSRDDIKDEIKKRGGKVSSSVSKKTDYVVVGKNPGEKLDTAKKTGVSIIGEIQFKRLINK